MMTTSHAIHIDSNNIPLCRRNTVVNSSEECLGTPDVTGILDNDNNKDNSKCTSNNNNSASIILSPPTTWFHSNNHNATCSNDESLSSSLLLPELTHNAVIDEASYSSTIAKTATNVNNGATKEMYDGTLQENHESPTDKNSKKPDDVSPTTLLENEGGYDVTDMDKTKWLAAAAMVGSPVASPSWQQISQHILPAAARELLYSAIYRAWYSAQKTYALHRRQIIYSDYGNTATGYYRSTTTNPPNSMIVTDLSTIQLPPFSTLPWVERQMVKEWRSYLPTVPVKSSDVLLQNDINDDDEHENDNNNNGTNDNTDIAEVDDDMIDFELARTLIPTPITRPKWNMVDSCDICHQTFGPTCLRHHCRMCGYSLCQRHSAQVHKLPHLGYDPIIPERVCDACKRILLDQNLAERIAWRLARCRDCYIGQLQPYFEVGLDSMDQILSRITQAALTMAKAIPLGAQASVAVETVDVLRKYGLNGIYTIMLRQEFLAAADLLLKALGINRTAWPLSVHELSAAIFYALAQHRAMRGLYPEREHMIHTIRSSKNTSNNNRKSNIQDEEQEKLPLVPQPVCDAVSDTDLASLLLYAPIALNFIYVEREVDMQLLAAQQGWRLLFAYLDQTDIIHMKLCDRPASAVFVHEERKVACLAIRGTTTIHDVITDIRQVPVPFPDFDTVATNIDNNELADEEWTAVCRGKGLAASGMVGAAVNLYREHIDSLVLLWKQGYKIRLTGHSLGGSVAVLLGVLVYKDLLELSGQDAFHSWEECDAPLRIYSYGTPSCVDLPLADAVEPFVTTVVLHDDVVPRLTPASCRGLLKHLLHIRETWVKDHLGDDIRAFTDRAKTAWAPRWRPGFTLSARTSVKIRRYCRKHIQYGKLQLRYVKDRLVGDDARNRTTVNQIIDHENDFKTSHASDSEKEPNLVIDFLGGLDSTAEGMVVDGDEYFDSDTQLLDNSDDDSDTTSDIYDQSFDNFNVDCDNGNGSTTPQLISTDNQGNGDTNEISGAVVLEEVPLPRMFIPGKIVHIYSHRGVYRASYVPRTFRDLRRISLAGNMLANHKTKSYYDALTEVANVRQAPENPPKWTSFDEDDTCSCCASRFTWASTSDNEAQDARDKHNCRSCGSLVCEPCSLNTVPIPSIGLTLPVRVCDRCYNDLDGILKIDDTSRKLTSYATNCLELESNMERYLDKPERFRQKRSVVVDELAQRVHASGLACS